MQSPVQNYLAAKEAERLAATAQGIALMVNENQRAARRNYSLALVAMIRDSAGENATEDDLVFEALSFRDFVDYEKALEMKSHCLSPKPAVANLFDAAEVVKEADELSKVLKTQGWQAAQQWLIAKAGAQ